LIFVIASNAMKAVPVAMQLHAPLEIGSALVTGGHAGGKVASFDMSHQ